MEIKSKNITHIEGDKYLVKVKDIEMRVELNEEMRKNLIGLKVIDETQESFESYVIKGAMDYFEMIQDSKIKKRKGWDDTI